jgi:uncharacterized protein YyaL (SSP411 family)
MNLLAKEKSPYLLQHAHNPVAWYSWGDDAFAEAKRRECPIFLSIGYSTCYWCHVMEKDSFEHQEVADALTPFVAIKMDREERPDVDTLYMDFVVGMQGQGGWPLSVFLTPDKVPFWGGTFFRKNQFIAILEEVSKAWSGRRAEIENSAHAIGEVLTRNAVIESGDYRKLTAEEVMQRILVSCEQRFDPVWGGFGQAPKFPPTSLLPLLGEIAFIRDDGACKQMLSTTLEMMNRGGIYDHLSGGFSRYSTDARWLVPHFEKMLYDNALLLKLYAQHRTLDAGYGETIRRSLEFLRRDFYDPASGLYFSAQDAGEVDREGDYYVWSYEELQSALSPVIFSALEKSWGVTEEGNFEGKNILHKTRAVSLTLTEEDNSIVSKLAGLRAKRTAPSIDKKSLADWNGLMLSALCACGKMHDAFSLADALVQTFLKDEIFYHRYADGEVAIEGMADDYAYVIAGLLDLYELSFESAYLEHASQLFELQLRKLYDPHAKAFRNSGAKDLIVATVGFLDGATPNANGISALNAIKLWHHTEKVTYHQIAEGIIGSAVDSINNYTFACPTMVRAFLNLSVYGGKISFGSQTPAEVVKKIREERSPWYTLVAKKGEGEKVILCRNSGICEELLGSL